MRPLYQISNEYQHILYKMQTGSPETQLEAANELEQVKGDLALKAQNCVSMLKTLEVEQEAIDIEIERLKGRSQSLGKQAEWLDKYIGICLNYQPIKAGIFNVKFRKSESVEVFGDVPQQYQRVKTVVEPDKTLIKQDLKAGAEIPGCRLIEKQNLLIK
jgi:hypothetical protein